MKTIFLAVFMLNLATMVTTLKITAPVLAEEAVESRHYLRLQQLSFDVLSSRCFYFDLADAFGKIPRDEADHLATVSFLKKLFFRFHFAAVHFAACFVIGLESKVCHK